MNRTEARESLDELSAVWATNVKRLQRPRRYWVVVGSCLAVFALLPMTAALPPLARISAPLVLVIAIAAVAGWKQPRAVRKIRMRGAMWTPLVAAVALSGVVAGLNHTVFEQTEWLWPMILAAAALFTLATVGGPALDRYWARSVSHQNV